MSAQRLPKLPNLLSRKLYKTSQTRGSQLSEIYQNRVSRNSTVLIPYEWWEQCREPAPGERYESGFIVLIDPDWYLDTPDADAILSSDGIALGDNALLNFQQRSQWDRYRFGTPPRLPNGEPLLETNTRIAPINGNVLARIHGTTDAGKQKIYLSFNKTSSRGAGIRVYEYASKKDISATRTQLEAYYWMSEGAIAAAIDKGMTPANALKRKTAILETAKKEGLLDIQRLKDARIIDEKSATVCPFCLERIPASSFYKRNAQAEGRETWDLTVTEVSLFHIDELRVGKLQHKPYNLGWGHHHCNIVVKDSGIDQTLSWVEEILERNVASGWKNQTSNSVPIDVSRSSVDVDLVVELGDGINSTS
ncbi:BstXI family restriction endonuclease [Corynebacterium pseudogenitalium]|uniref:BstXI family restriction endonuclease n=1 Tax=Corynebacterium pseudogenitalium TaxID=38303 RepID=UPI00210CB9D3|nr:BstXI family restriction endonuclease [Corynebacterium pseudogenitalium]MCQ4608668.1 BstXI family restriction endonuclease [Corynebacterium pseudogenitalium]